MEGGNNDEPGADERQAEIQVDVSELKEQINQRDTESWDFSMEDKEQSTEMLSIENRLQDRSETFVNMRREIAAVVFYLKMLVMKGQNLGSDKFDLFAERLAVALQEKFRGHWYPETPSKGQAYRCIRVNRFHKQDPELLRACRESGVQYSDLGLFFDLTLWVDPGEVCCRYGENNPCFSVATFSNDEEEDKDVAKVTSDYHSGSSSDEESTCTSLLTVPNSRCSYKVLNPAVPAWHPKKMVPGKVHILPWPHHSFRPCSRAPHTLRPGLRVPPGYGGPGCWDSAHNQAHCYS